ncbi:MAG TPA: flagellar protein export ATPase FliI [Gemmatimonadales bacterium]|nr:flagellar protein export ATPase FliI [Gemmatimonadales bacterium]
MSAGGRVSHLCRSDLSRLAALEAALADAAASLPKVRVGGVLTEVTPVSCRVSGLSHVVKLGDCVAWQGECGTQVGEIVRIDDANATVKPFEAQVKAALGTRVWRTSRPRLHPHLSWLGRTIDALGRPIDESGPLIQGSEPYAVERVPPPPLRRQRVSTPVKTGVRVIDCFTPLCAGQRIGIFAGSGVGKSTLLSMLARSRGFDVAVVALVGERGREVREFLEDALGADRARAVAVVSTGDESPMMRRLAPKTAMAVAEFFRNLGKSVLLIVDSVTRFAHAAREVALAAGEPPVARGFTPGVFSDLPKLLERAGPGEKDQGSITGIFSVLVDGDDHNDPVADSIRGTLDGHIVLNRSIADQGRYPAVDILASVSRLAGGTWTPDERRVVTALRALIASFEETRDLRLMGGYRQGSDPELDNAVQIVPKLYEALKQGPDDAATPNVFQELARLLSGELAAGRAHGAT